MREPIPSITEASADGSADLAGSPPPPPGLSHRGASVLAVIALGAWALATIGAPWLAPRVSAAVDAAETALGVELAPQRVLP